MKGRSGQGRKQIVVVGAMKTRNAGRNDTQRIEERKERKEWRFEGGEEEKESDSPIKETNRNQRKQSKERT